MNVATRWEELRTRAPKTRIRDAAAELGVSEAELLETTVGSDATRLDTDFAALLHGLPKVGHVMALTRNASAVHEVKGTYGGVELGPHAGQVIGEHIDLRVFLSQWKHGYAVDEVHPHEAGQRRLSLHVFDKSGEAVHKVYLQPDGNVDAWRALVAERAAKSVPPLVLEPNAPKPADRADHAIDVAALTQTWDGMQDTHEFFHLLAAHAVGRVQALRLAGESRARRVQTGALETVLRGSNASGERIMIFVGSRGCIQIFSGVVGKVARTGPWFNVLDVGFNLHLREDRVASAWVVAKPTRSGVVSSLELYDAAGETIALIFRKRDDRDRAEDPAWRDLLGSLPAGPGRAS